MKSTVYITETRWSELLELMRKDMEGTFGIKLHGVDYADKIWFTCCALHNMLLDNDGITGEWNNSNGLFDFNEESDRMPFSLQRLANPSKRRHWDTSGMGPGETVDSDDELNEPDLETVSNTLDNNYIVTGINSVNHFTADYFQEN